MGDTASRSKCPKCRDWRCGEGSGPCFAENGPPNIKSFEFLTVVKKIITNPWHLCILPSKRI